MSTDTPTATELDTLTRDDIHALKAADGVTFHHSQRHGTRVRLYLRTSAGEPRIWTATEQRLFPMMEDGRAADRYRDLAVESRMGGYRDGGETSWNGDTHPQAEGYASNLACKFNHDWQTVVGLLRIGDRLVLQWNADNNTETIREHGLHHDELRVEIRRTGRRRPMSFLIDSRVCADNSARMIRRNGFNY